MITRKLVASLGCAQLISWGISYYLMGALGSAMAAELGWSMSRSQAGFALGLLVMGLCSPWIGAWSDRHGGRPVMCTGALCNALGCALLASSHGMVCYLIGWLCLGVGMRCTLYDAAFAALARIGGPGPGPATRRAMSQITLPGGLSATVFWPLGQALATWLGWRGALWCYALLALVTWGLHRSLPPAQPPGQPPGQPLGLPPAPGTVTAHPARPLRQAQPDTRRIWLAGILFALLTTLANVVNGGMSAHMTGILAATGAGTAIAVWIAALRGVGQCAARLLEVLFGRAIDPLSLNLLACLLLPLAFGLALGNHATVSAVAFALLYGAGNGLLSITRGTLPLVLFDHRSYGRVTGRLLAPGFLLSALAPVLYAEVMQRWSAAAGLWLSWLCALGIAALAAMLWWRFRTRSDRAGFRPMPSGQSRD